MRIGLGIDIDSRPTRRQARMGRTNEIDSQNYICLPSSANRWRPFYFDNPGRIDASQIPTAWLSKLPKTTTRLKTIGMFPIRPLLRAVI